MSTSSTQRTATLTLMGICVASLVFSQVRSLTDVESALKSEGLSEHRARELLAASVPVGGVIPYFGNLPLPPNWQLCDGSDLRLDADVGLRLRLSGKTPDLRRRFLYGASSTNETGITGGLSQASVNLGSTADDGRHAHSVPHSHRLPSLTGPISQATPSPTPFVAIWGTPSQVGSANIKADSSSNDPEGQHLHNLGGSTEPTDATTSQEGSHRHEMGTINVPTLPPFVQCVHAIRIY